jgi:hypothetical protein
MNPFFLAIWVLMIAGKMGIVAILLRRRAGV